MSKRKHNWTTLENKKCVSAVISKLQEMNCFDSFVKYDIFPQGFPWKKVAQAVGTRDGRQCRGRWVNYLSPNISHLPWTAEEDNKLKKLMEEYPKKWKLISDKMSGRPPNQVKMRWRLISRETVLEPRRILRRTTSALDVLAISPSKAPRISDKLSVSSDRATKVTARKETEICFDADDYHRLLWYEYYSGDNAEQDDFDIITEKVVES